MAQIVEPDEIGKIFAIFGIAADIAALIGSTLFSTIYYATEDMYPALIFWILVCICAILFVSVLWVHVIFAREQRNVTHTIKQDK